MIVSEIIFSIRDRLAKAKLECADPLLHAQQLVELSLGWSSHYTVLKWHDSLSSSQLDEVEKRVARRLKGEPFQYIAGYEWFWNSKFAVGPGCLIPRRETEHLVELMLQNGPDKRLKIMELGAGSGNIGISVLLERPNWSWIAFEKNPETWPYLEANLKSLLPTSAEYELVKEDFFQAFQKFEKVDALVSNPPYVKSADFNRLSKEVLSEPRVALEAGTDGLDVVRPLAAVAKQILVENGLFLCEIAEEQGESGVSILKELGFRDPQVFKDLAGLDRVLFARS